MNGCDGQGKTDDGNSTSSAISLLPTLICKAVGAIVAQNKMVEDRDADKVTGLTESGSEHAACGSACMPAGPGDCAAFISFLQ